MELEHDSLKGFARLTKKGELQSRIDRKNEEIDLLKLGLSGIVKRYGFQTIHDFYKAFAAAKTAYDDYRTNRTSGNFTIFVNKTCIFVIKQV